MYSRSSRTRRKMCKSRGQFEYLSQNLVWLFDKIRGDPPVRDFAFEFDLCRTIINSPDFSFSYAPN